MIGSFDGLEMDDSITDGFSCFDCEAMRASNIIHADYHRNGHLIDRVDRDKISLTLSTFLEIRGRILLEPTCVGVLPPMRLVLDGNGLAVRAHGVEACPQAKSEADLAVITVLPVWSVCVMHTY